MAAANVLDSLYWETLEKLGTGFDERGRNRASPLCLHEVVARQAASRTLKSKNLPPALSSSSTANRNRSAGEFGPGPGLEGSSLPPPIASRQGSASASASASRNRLRVRVVFIAVHVRNGDYEYVSSKSGALLPPNVYYLAAFEHLRELYARRERQINEQQQLLREGGGDAAANASRVQFLLRLVICTDDRHWVQRNFPDALRPYSVLIGGRNAHYERSDALYAELAREHPSQWLDLVILSLCEHSILSIGTFGWWAAYLRRPLFLPLTDPPRFLDDDGAPTPEPKPRVASAQQQPVESSRGSKRGPEEEATGDAAEQASFFLMSTRPRRRRRTTTIRWPSSTLRPMRRPRARRSAAPNTPAPAERPSDASEQRADAEETRCPGETLYYSEICQPDTHYYSLYCAHAARYFPPEWHAFDAGRVSATLERYTADPNFL